MSALDSGPCQNWDPICEAWPADAEAVTGAAVQAATEVLWNRTRRRFGLCEVALRPCRRDCFTSWPWVAPLWNDASSWGWPFPALIGGLWFNLGCGSCSSGNCSCAVLHEVVLPSPVANVTEVKVDGVVLDPSAYRVDDYRLLVRTDGEAWPRCNNLNLADTETGTWSVTAEYGEVVPTLGQLAVGELAAEIAKSCVGAGDCALPKKTVRQVTRQGVTKVFFDAESSFSNNRVGLYYCDLFLSTYNPGGGHVATIFNIDGPRARRVGT